MNLQHRVNLLVKLGEYILSDDAEWKAVKDRAEATNGWFTQSFIDLAANNIATAFLQRNILENFITSYNIPAVVAKPKKVGVVMAGNIPLVGFHDWLCVFLSGHNAVVKSSSKDLVLLPHLVQKMGGWDEAVLQQTTFEEMLKGCDAYIATGSNNSARYFEYYFGKYPSIIRKNRTSVAILTGDETMDELSGLSDDINLYFGLGCRNVTKVYVPEHYDFVPLLEANKKYSYFGDHSKYKNNYDYQLAILLLNKQYYMSTGFLLVTQNPGLFSPISHLHYELYHDKQSTANQLAGDDRIQCLVGKGLTPFGKTQQPSITDYADGVDTMQFLSNL